MKGSAADVPANGAVEVNDVGGTSGPPAAGAAGDFSPTGRDGLRNLLDNHAAVGDVGGSGGVNCRCGIGAAPIYLSIY